LETFDADEAIWGYGYTLFDEIPKTCRALVEIPHALLGSLASAVSVGAMLYGKSPSLTMTMLGAFVVKNVVIDFLISFFKELRRAFTRRIEDPNYIWYAALEKENVRTMRSCSREKKEIELYELTLRGQRRSQSQGKLLSSVTRPVYRILHQSVEMLGLWYAGNLVLGGQLSPGDLHSFNHMVESVLNEGKQVLEMFNGDNIETLDTAGIMVDKLNYVPRIGLYHPPMADMPDTKQVQGHIEMRDVFFAYPSKPGVSVLNGLSFQVSAGSRVGIMGKAGAGKSTIFQLLQRFYDPMSGQVLLDGRDIREYNPMWLREQIAVVSQEVPE
jgi:ABC-type multidrug transport system fused ATPase/permease subunit